MKSKLAALLLGGLVAVVATTVVVVPAFAVDPTGGDPELAAVRAASARYHSFQQALKDGYTTENEPCVAAPGLGTMGIHAVNPSLIADPAIDPLRPEILVYLPRNNGELELVAIEYFRRAADQTPPFDESDKPVLFGRSFDGIMPEHAPGMGWHYDLHVWLWQANPAGLFAAFNSDPELACP